MTPDDQPPASNPPLTPEERTRLNERADAASKEVRERQAQRGEASQTPPEEKPTQEVARERAAGQQAGMKSLVDTEEFKRKVQAERDNQFRHEVGLFVSRASPTQRKILQDELDKVSGKVQPVPQRDLHAELHANEAAKIDKAAADVATRQAPPLPFANRPDVLDMSQYERIGEQWRMSLGMVNGHMAYRWLSVDEARELGLEKLSEVPNDADMGQAGGGVQEGTNPGRVPGPHGVPESPGYIVGGDGRRVPIPQGHHGGIRGVSERIADLGDWPAKDVDDKKEPGA